jgi:hypothetical protein
MRTRRVVVGADRGSEVEGWSSVEQARGCLVTKVLRTGHVGDLDRSERGEGFGTTRTSSPVFEPPGLFRGDSA